MDRRSTMDKYDFIRYTAERYGVDDSVPETLVDMFADSLHDLLSAGYSVNIDDIGEFKTTPLFPNGLNHKNNIALARAAKRHIVSFKASKSLIHDVA